MKKLMSCVLALLSACILTLVSCSDSNVRPSPDQATNRLKLGNQRFVSGKSAPPIVSAAQMRSAPLNTAWPM